MQTHIIYKIYLNSSSKFHVWNIWSSDPPQMREHLAVANEQAGEVPGSNGIHWDQVVVTKQNNG